MPLESVGEAFKTMGHLTSVAWAIDSFEYVVIRDLKLESVLLLAGIRVGQVVPVYALAGWRSRLE